MPLKLMGQRQVQSILEGMERRGEIGHDWAATWPWAKQVAVAHSLHGGQLAQYESQMGRAQEWPKLGEEYGGPLAGGAGAWYAPEPGHAPYPASVFGTVPGWEPTETGLIGPGKMGAGKIPKRFRLSTQEYGLPVDRPAQESWIQPAGGGAPTRGAVMQTAFMHGLPPGAGGVSPAFPEVGFPFTKHVPITPGAQITAVGRPGAVARRGGALELLQTTQGKFSIPTKDWEYQRLTGQPKKVPYSMPGRPEVTEAYQFQVERVAQAQQGMVSQKSGMVKAFMGTGYDPQAMFGPGVEQILPYPKEPSGFMAQALGSQYGRQWYEQWAAGAGEEALPPGTQWKGAAAEQLTRAGEAFVQAHTQMRTFPMTVSEELLGQRRGGVWTQKVGQYWGQMPKGAQPESIGGGRYQIQQQMPVMQMPFLSQYRREHVGRPFVSHEEIAQLSLSRPRLASQLWQEGAGARQPYSEMIRSAAVSRRGQARGQEITKLPWGQIEARGRAMMKEELGWVPEEQRVSGQYLARAGAEMAPGPMTAQFGGSTLQLPSFKTMQRLGVPGPLGEEVSPLMTSWHKMVERAAMVGMPGGMEQPQAKTEMRGALRQFWLGKGRVAGPPGEERVERGMGLKTFASMGGVQREAMGTRPKSAWEGPILAHTGLRPGEEIWGDIALREASGAGTPEELAALKQQMAAGGGRGISTTGWRRPISDPYGQVGGQGVKMMTEEMAREAGMDVTGLGRGVMTSPFTMFEQRGDVDADRMLRLLEQKVQWMKGKPVLGQLQKGIEAGTGLMRRIAGGLRLHAPEETPQGTALQQIFGSTAKFNEARSWMEEIQGMGRMEQVTEFFGGTRGKVAPWGDIAQATQMGLASKEAMGRTYNRFIREMRPEMTKTPTGRRAFRGLAAGPYQSAIDVTQLSKGARTYLAMHETLGVKPSGRGYGFGEVFSPYERTEKGELKPRLSKLGGYGAIAGKAIGSIMGMSEVPLSARAYGIGGEEMHQQVGRMMMEKRQPSEVMGMMMEKLNIPETELLAQGGPMLRSLARKLYAKTPEGEVTQTTYQGKERTVQMPEWASAPAPARALRAAGQRMGTTSAVMARGRGLPVKQFEAALSGGMELTPEQAAYVGRAAAEMGIGGRQQAAAPSAYERQRTSDQPAVDAWNGQMQAEIARRTREATYGPQDVAPRRGQMGPPSISDAGLRAAIAGGGGGGAPRLPAPPAAPAAPGGGAEGGGYGAMPGIKWHRAQVWGGGGMSESRWMEETQMRGGHVKGLETAIGGMARNAPAIEKAFKDLADSSAKLNKTFEEGGKLRKEEIGQLKERQTVAKAAIRLAKEYERQVKPTMGMGGSEQALALRQQAMGGLDPLMAQANLAQTQMAEAGMRLPGVTPEGGGRGGILDRIGRAGQKALGGWALMRARRMWSMFGAPVQQAMQQYAGGQLQMQQAMYQGGLPTGMGGAPIEILQRRAGAARWREGLGEAGWQAWGGVSSPLRGDPGPLGPLAAIGGPSLGLGLGAAALGASAPVAAGLGLGAAAIGAAGYATSAAKDQEAIGLAAAQARTAEGGLEGFGKWAWGNVRGITGVLARGVKETPSGVMGMALMPLKILEMSIGIAKGDVGFRPEEMAYGQQIMEGDLGKLRDPEGRLAAMQYFTREKLQPRLPGMEEGQLRQLMGGYMGLTGETNLGQANMQLLQQAGQRAQMLGQAPGAAFQPFQQLAGAMGRAPGEGTALQLAEQAPWGNEREMQQYLHQWGKAAPLMAQAGAMFGPQAQGMDLWRDVAGGGAQQRRQVQQVLGGDRYRWSDIGRAQGRQDLITMEEGGLPVFTTEMRGIQDEMQTQQRGYRDWRQQQQYDQMQENQQYIRAGWTIQDQQRELRAAQTDWQYGYQQRAHAMQGTQWAENFMVQGRQQQEAMGLGRQIFETRVGFQQQDIGRQEERGAQRYEWSMEDWAYGENRAQLSYGWQMEDLSEAIRYSSGRQRRQLMKQQERGTISESMRRQQSERRRGRLEEQEEWRGEDIATQRERNEELLALQREQFEMRKRHWEEDREIQQRFHEEGRTLEEERMTKNREFYELGKELDDERITLQRQHSEEQMEWQLEAWEKQKEFNVTMDETQDRYRDLQRQQQDTIANFARMMTYTEELTGAFLGFLEQAVSQVPNWDTGAPEDYRWGETPEERRGHQAGGFIHTTEQAMIHEGEFVVPAAGQLVVRGDNPESMAKFSEMVRLLAAIVAAVEQGKGSVVVVETNNAQRAQQSLSLSDESWGVMPGA